MNLVYETVIHPFEVTVCYIGQNSIMLRYYSVEPKEITIVGSCCLRKDGKYERTLTGLSRRTIDKNGTEVSFVTKKPSKEYIP